MRIKPAIVPNVVLAIVDDLAYGDLSCLGNPYTRTVSLDALHEQSVRLTHYCSGPLCTPARGALLTGRHPFRTRAIDTYLGRSNVDPSEVTLARLLRDSGYRTGLFGKWHLGDTRPSDPNSMGFEEALYHTGGGLRQPGNHGLNSYFDPDLLYNGRRVPSRGYCTDIFTEAACDFIRSAQEPFFCYLAFNAVHTPLEIVEHWADPFRQQGLPEVWCRLYGMLQNLDENMGRVTATLEEAGLRENTVVIFTADHGPCGSARHEGRTRFNAGLRGTKGSFYEGGVRVPCFWSWPSRWRARDEHLLSNPVDALPTLARMCGASLPQDRKIDGADLTQVLAGEESEPALKERSICLQWHRGARPVKGLNAVCIGPRYKWYSQEPGRVELYDLHDDPREEHDIAAAEQALVSEMGATYDAWFEDVCGERELLNPKREPGVPILVPVSEDETTILTWQDWVPYSGDEGWSAVNPGYWLVTVSEKARYRIIVELGADAPAAPLHFQFGPVEHGIPPIKKVDALCFELELPAATAQLHCCFEQDGKRKGVQTVSISRYPVRPAFMRPGKEV
jgi:uncharacterized sulfatase